MSDDTVQALSETLTHNALEKEDIRLESKIDKILFAIDGEYGVNENIKDLKKKVEFTNGKVRAHQVWIAGIIGGAFVLSVLGIFLRDTFVGLVTQAVVKQLTENSQKYDVIIEP